MPSPTTPDPHHLAPDPITPSQNLLRPSTFALDGLPQAPVSASCTSSPLLPTPPSSPHSLISLLHLLCANLFSISTTSSQIPSLSSTIFPLTVYLLTNALTVILSPSSTSLPLLLCASHPLLCTHALNPSFNLSFITLLLAATNPGDTTTTFAAPPFPSPLTHSPGMILLCTSTSNLGLAPNFLPSPSLSLPLSTAHLLCTNAGATPASPPVHPLGNIPLATSASANGLASRLCASLIFVRDLLIDRDRTCVFPNQIAACGGLRDERGGRWERATPRARAEVWRRWRWR